MDEKTDLGPINVNMGDGNSVAHIGHIVYQEPGPRPNAITQDGVEVGVFSGQPTQKDGMYVFPKLCFDRPPFNTRAPFAIQSLTLRFISSQIYGSTGRLGAETVVEIRNAVCEVVS